MSMTCKERVRRAIRHEPVDFLPTQVVYTTQLGKRMAEHFGMTLEELPAFLNNHLLRVDLSYEERLSDDGRTRYDWWGVGFDTHEEGYFIRESPLADSKDLSRFAWPDPRAPHLLDEAARLIEADAGQHFVLPNFGFCLFERAWTLRGFENFLMDLLLDPDFAEELLDHITQIQVTLIRRFIALGVDGGYFGDDYGAQHNLLISAIAWRKMIKPRLAHLFETFHKAGLPVILHSDGDIRAIMPDLVEIGLDVYNPVQPEVIDHRWLRNTFKSQLAYFGGISTQTTLPTGTPEQVKAAVELAVQTLAPDHTGYIVGPSHRMMADIPMSSIEAMLSTFAAMAKA